MRIHLRPPEQQILNLAMLDNPLSELCAICRRLFENWGKMQRLGLKVFSTNYDFADVEKSEAQGCGLCSIMLAELPSKTLQTLQSGQYMRNLPVTLSGGEYKRGQSNTITLRIDCAGPEKVEIDIYHNTGTSTYSMDAMLADE